jgi:hypothetical protein
MKHWAMKNFTTHPLSKTQSPGDVGLNVDGCVKGAGRQQERGTIQETIIL